VYKKACNLLTKQSKLTL